MKVGPCKVPTCDGGQCVAADATDGTKCGAGGKCDEGGVCAKGACKPTNPVNCNDENICTTDSCDPKTGCSWVANSAACDDGDKCTAADVCENGQCKAGVAVVAEKTCGDGNPCTKAACDAQKGCTNTPIADKSPCDDNDVCTKGEVCTQGQCSGGKAGGCDDGKPCTNDICDPKSGGCSWTGKQGPCDDGDPCTAAGTCKTGKCAPGPAKECDDNNSCTKDTCDSKAGGCVFSSAGAVGAACDDNSKCTTDTKCAADGKCTGKTVVCDDGNLCTHDLCNPDTGKCGFSANNGAVCDAGPCTSGDTCNNGKCVAGAGATCDDGNTCTIDSCDTASGKCAFKAGKDGVACEDGKKCSTGDTCKAGVCTPGKDACTVASVDISCPSSASATSHQGFSVQNPGSYQVRWRFDQTPTVAALKDYGCTLNFNDTNDYCQTQGSGCRGQTARYVATPVFDATKIQGKVDFTFDFFRDMDTTGDAITIDFYRQGSDIRRHRHTMPLTGCGGAGQSCLNKLVKAYAIHPEGVAGYAFRAYIYASQNTTGNKGKGFFMDALRVAKGQETPEICDDSKDNDGDGATDCKDTECQGHGPCVEQCADGKDNDGDDKVDCDDSDCAKQLACAKPLWQSNIECDKPHGWTLVNRSGFTVKWAGDKTPTIAALAPYGCTMNLNDGTKYCQNQQQAGSNFACSALTAPYNNQNWYLSAMTPWIDGTKIAGNVIVAFAAYLDIDAADDLRLRVYVEGNNNYVHQFSVPKTGCGGANVTCQKKLQANVQFTLTQVKQKKFRLRFAHVGQTSGGYEVGNQGAGEFVDDVRIYAAP